MIATIPFLILNLMQGTPSSGWRIYVSLRLLLQIWFWGYLLISCKRLSQELKYQLRRDKISIVAKEG